LVRGESKNQIAEGGDRAFYTIQTLVRIFDACLRFLHPFTPFVTEVLWGHLREACQDVSSYLTPPEGWEDALIIARWPEPQATEGWEAKAIEDFSLIQEMVRAIRNIRSEYKVEPGRKIACTIAAGKKAQIINSQQQTFTLLAGLDHGALKITAEPLVPADDRVTLVVGPIEIALPLAGLVDLAAERARLETELAESHAQIERLENLLASPFAQKAPPDVVEKEREKLAAYRETAARLKQQLG
jgi:valyl-tRNA synthetase